MTSKIRIRIAAGILVAVFAAATGLASSTAHADPGLADTGGVVERGGPHVDTPVQLGALLS